MTASERALARSSPECDRAVTETGDGLTHEFVLGEERKDLALSFFLFLTSMKG